MNALVGLCLLAAWLASWAGLRRFRAEACRQEQEVRRLMEDLNRYVDTVRDHGVGSPEAAAARGGRPGDPLFAESVRYVDQIATWYEAASQGGGS